MTKCSLVKQQFILSKELSNQPFCRGIGRPLQKGWLDNSFDKMTQAPLCRTLLSTFFSRTKKIRALWFPIILESASSSSSSSSSSKSREFGLHDLLGLDYDLYLSFMKECGLIYSFQHNKTRSTIVVPSVVKGRYNPAGYTWDDFLSEFHLSADIELSYICPEMELRNIIFEWENLVRVLLFWNSSGRGFAILDLRSDLAVATSKKN